MPDTGDILLPRMETGEAGMEVVIKGDRFEVMSLILLGIHGWKVSPKIPKL